MGKATRGIREDLDLLGNLGWDGVVVMANLDFEGRFEVFERKVMAWRDEKSTLDVSTREANTVANLHSDMRNEGKASIG